MEIRILEKKGKHLRVEVRDVDKSFLTVLQKELAKDENVAEAGINFGHPLLGKFEIVMNTTGKAPEDVLAKAVERIGKMADKVNGAFQEMK